jgi:molecular chaperone DnaK (HSP70)
MYGQDLRPDMGACQLAPKRFESLMRSSEAEVVVSLDFGTTFSGCAYATRSNPTQVFSPFLWPDTDGHYPKTKTEVYYARDGNGDLVFKSWGATALVDFCQAESPQSGELIQEFKLHLAPGSHYGEAPEPLPAGLTVDVVITDYLRAISRFYMDQLRETFGSEFGMQEVQWCLTVPAIWDDRAKQLMKSYAEAAGMVRTRNRDGSLTHFNQLKFDKGDKFMTADLGGGTVDIVVHEKLWQSSNDATNLEVANNPLCAKPGIYYGDTTVIRR